MGGFVLSDFESLMKGGSHGKAIVPGKSQESRLVQMIEGAIQPRMPMSGELEAHEIASIKTWVNQGAKLDQDPAQLQSLHEPEVPKIKPASMSTISNCSSLRWRTLFSSMPLQHAPLAA